MRVANPFFLILTPHPLCLHTPHARHQVPPLLVQGKKAVRGQGGQGQAQHGQQQRRTIQRVQWQVK